MMIIRSGLVVLLYAVGLTLCLTSCNSGPDVADPNKQLQKDTLAIDAYLSANALEAENDPSGLRMVITKVGTGLPANIYDSIDVDYVGKLFSNGVIFDQGNIKSPLLGVISGWQIAFTKLPEGSEAVLYIPSYWAYGSDVQQSIPANSILVFTITKFKKLIIKSNREKLASDTVAIDNYLESKNIDAVKDSSGLRYVITIPTPGRKPTWYDRVSLKYSIKLLTNDGTIVYSEEAKPSALFYSRLIDYNHGMKIGLSKLAVGSKATLYIPSGLGFGPRNATNSSGTVVVPANSNIIVDIELQKIE